MLKIGRVEEFEYEGRHWPGLIPGPQYVVTSTKRHIDAYEGSRISSLHMKQKNSVLLQQAIELQRNQRL
ncbi:unnamed protein product, partial [Iphiclides podalirius]